MFTKEQNLLIQQMQQVLGLDPKDVSLDENNELFFTIEALNLLTIKLGTDIQALSIVEHQTDGVLNIVSSVASITLADGRYRAIVKSAQIGERIGSTDKTIDTIIQASNIADSRAVRSVLRMIGFDPIKEFRNFLENKETERTEPLLSQAEKDRRLIHKLRDEMNMDDETYRRHLVIVTNGKCSSTKQMNDQQLSLTVAYFLGMDAQFRKAA